GVELMLTEDPDSYLDKAATLDRIGSRQTDKLDQLKSAQRSLKQQRSEAAAKLTELERERKELKRQKKAVLKKLAAAKRLLGGLSPAERAERERASRSDGRGGTFAVGGGQASSARAAAAVAAARSVLGRPYVWGAAGPGSFDCSGLMQWAYGRAGVAIPRTSQAQRSSGRQVPLSQAQPGDLVLYRDDASHVGMYVGGGKVVHAPHPGAPVRYDPVGMMPVSSVTRP
ncbi:MAG TPA: NlpC/P60 family protein, partial [Streptomyces sp.]|nr:NlpC/P60 family protein [Streptomyces sp.]